MAGMPINESLFNQYVSVSRILLAELSKYAGESYDPGADYDLDNAIHRARGISQAVLTMIGSLHAFHPPMIAPTDGVPASQVTGIPPSPAPPAAPLQEQPPPASV